MQASVGPPKHHLAADAARDPDSKILHLHSITTTPPFVPRSSLGPSQGLHSLRGELMTTRSIRSCSSRKHLDPVQSLGLVRRLISGSVAWDIGSGQGVRRRRYGYRRQRTTQSWFNRTATRRAGTYVTRLLRSNSSPMLWHRHRRCALHPCIVRSRRNQIQSQDWAHRFPIRLPVHILRMLPDPNRI